MRSVVICAYTTKRWDQVKAAVESVAMQAADTEIVIVIDHNDELLELCLAEWPQHRVVANRFGQGLSGARNTGVSDAAGEVIAFLDDDAVADPGWLDALTAAFADESVGGVGGRVLPAWSEDPPEWLPEEFWWVVGCSYKGLPSGAREIRNPIGANMAFSRSVFEHVGGFREEIGRIGTIPLGCEETELSIRAKAAGFTVWYRPDAVVHHHVPADRTTIRYFLRRCYAEGLSKAVVSSFAGRSDGLESERAYVSHALPTAVRAALVQCVSGPARGDGLLRAAAVIAGLAAAGIGFVQGTAVQRKRRLPLGRAPVVASAPAA
ncbi:MAG TPA: glycosyltransferase [Ilumatobacteraceae bacterium]